MKNQNVLVLAILATLTMAGAGAGAQARQQVDDSGIHQVHQLPPGATTELSPPLIPHDWNQRTGKFEPRKITTYERGTGAGTNYTTQQNQYEQFTNATKSNGSDCRNGGGSQDSTCAQFVIGGQEEPVERTRINDQTTTLCRTTTDYGSCPRDEAGIPAISGQITYTVTLTSTETRYMDTSGVWQTRNSPWTEQSRSESSNTCVYPIPIPTIPTPGEKTKACYVSDGDQPIPVRFDEHIRQDLNMYGKNPPYYVAGHLWARFPKPTGAPADVILRMLSNTREDGKAQSHGSRTLWCSPGMTDAEVDAQKFGNTNLPGPARGLQGSEQYIVPEGAGISGPAFIWDSWRYTKNTAVDAFYGAAGGYTTTVNLPCVGTRTVTTTPLVNPMFGLDQEIRKKVDDAVNLNPLADLGSYATCDRFQAGDLWYVSPSIRFGELISPRGNDPIEIDTNGNFMVPFGVYVYPWSYGSRSTGGGGN